MTRLVRGGHSSLPEPIPARVNVRLVKGMEKKNCVAVTSEILFEPSVRRRLPSLVLTAVVALTSCDRDLLA